MISRAIQDATEQSIQGTGPNIGGIIALVLAGTVIAAAAYVGLAVVLHKTVGRQAYGMFEKFNEK